MSNVRLIAYTTANLGLPELNGLHTPQDIVAYCARVSNPANQNNTDTADKLLAYLIKNKHWSPFEQCSATLEINTTRDIGRQILRHRSFVFQEFSQRYAKASDLGFIWREARLQDAKNRQNSVDVDDDTLQAQWRAYQDTTLDVAKTAYQWALDNGIAKEQARCVLPEGMTLSRIYMTGNLRSWFHYIELRSKPGTQKEHKEIVLECAESLKGIFPLIERAVYTEGVLQTATENSK